MSQTCIPPKKRIIIPAALGALLLFLSTTQITAQPLFSYDITGVKLTDTITTNMEMVFLSRDSSLIQYYNQLNFTRTITDTRKVTAGNVSKKCILRFKVFNPATSAKGVYFFPGFYFYVIDLFKEDRNTLVPLPRIVPDNPDSIGYRYFEVPANDSATIVVQLKMEKTYNNVIRPRLIYELYLPAYVTQVHTVTSSIDMVTYLICGLFLMMTLFSLANYLSGSDDEFLYYSLYGSMLGGMLFIKTFYNNQTNTLNYFIESYLDFILQTIGIIFYLMFLQRFINTRDNHPFLHKLFKTGIFLLIGSMIVFTGYHFLSDNFPVTNAIETFTKISLTLLLLPAVIVYGIKNWHDKILRFIIWGNLCMLVFSVFSQALIMFGKFPKSIPALLSNSLFYYEIGLLLEFIFFMIALSYKNRIQLIHQTREREQLKTENQMKEYEKELAVFKGQQEERDRISADMHDELGSGMTVIRLMCEIAKNKMKGNVPKEIERISDSANDVLNKMNAIIWTMNSGNDTVDNLVSYIRSYAQEYLENTSIQCKINTPEQVQHKEMSGDKRRNIFLCVKETLNNALKHSRATEMAIDIEFDKKLTIRIADNGVGIDMTKLRPFGNGIQNMKRRMAITGGDIKIVNDGGTVTVIELLLD